LASEAARRRYWARSAWGFARFHGARPNTAHQALAELESTGAVRGVITQNVDRLHQAAGSRRVIELHGALADVRCLGCGAIEARAELQRRLSALNPQLQDLRPESAPDGDAELDEASVEAFTPAACIRCSGLLKPDVVFFGENVPPSTVAAAFTLLGEAEVLLVVGSSLVVFSGYRFVREASRRGLPIAIVNLGSTRGDVLARVKVEARAGECLPRVASALLGGGPQGGLESAGHVRHSELA
jgi:NAD-dependent SIR2 family protein deacetylase